LSKKVHKGQDQERDQPLISETLAHELILGSFEYCFFGDTSRWSELGASTESIQNFTSKYDAYFMEDFRWTLHNWNDMVANKKIFKRWWFFVDGLRTDDMELESIPDFIRKFRLESCLEKLDRRSFLTLIFKAIYDTYIKRLFSTTSNQKMEYVSRERQLDIGFRRYMMGQLIIFFRHHDFSIESLDPLLELLHDKNRILTVPLISNMRAYYEMYLAQLANANLITKDDQLTFAEICPLFKPFIVDYDHFQKAPATSSSSNHDEKNVIEMFVKQILNV
jgi:hypothetical protein